MSDSSAQLRHGRMCGSTEILTIRYQQKIMESVFECVFIFLVFLDSGRKESILGPERFRILIPVWVCLKCKTDEILYFI